MSSTTPSPPLISINQEADPALWSLADVNAWHLKWTPPAVGTGEREQARAKEELWGQIRRFQEDRQRSGRPGILSSDGAGTLWAARIDEVRQELSTEDGLEHLEIFDQHTSWNLRRLGRVRRDGTWSVGYKENTDRLLENLRNRARALRPTRLEPGGALELVDGKLCWNGTPIRLHGLSPTYGVLASRRLFGPGIVRFLADQGVNLWRVWCLEQWTALDHPRAALCPWAGRPGNYDLDTFDPRWWDDLEALLDEARTHGLVIQLTLFDWAGYLQAAERGRWHDNPLNAINNRQRLIDEAVPRGGYPKAINDTEGPVWEVVRRFLERIRDTVAGYGNVLLEIANEPRHVEPEAERRWHRAVAAVLRGSSAQDSTSTDP